MSHPPFPPPGPGPGPARKDGQYRPTPSRGLPIIALAVAVLALVTTWIPFLGVFLLPLSLIAIALAVVALVLVAGGRAVGRGPAVAGLLVGLLSVVTGIGGQVLFFFPITQVTGSTAGPAPGYEPSPPVTSAPTGTPAPDSPTATATPGEDTFLDVVFGAPEIGAGTTRVPVTFTNTGADPAMYVVLLAATRDGSVTSTSVVTSDLLQPGRSQTLDAFTFVADPEDLRDATFSVSSVTRLSG